MFPHHSSGMHLFSSASSLDWWCIPERTSWEYFQRRLDIGLSDVDSLTWDIYNIKKSIPAHTVPAQPAVVIVVVMNQQKRDHNLNIIDSLNWFSKVFLHNCNYNYLRQSAVSRRGVLMRLPSHWKLSSGYCPHFTIGRI